MANFYNLPRPWNPGYVIPKYVMAEPPGRGTFTTAWLPRGTISSITPNFVAKPGVDLLGRENAGLGALGCPSIGGCSSLGDDTLGALSPGRDYELGPAPMGDIGFNQDTAIKAAVVVGVAAAAYFLLKKKRR